MTTSCNVLRLQSGRSNFSLVGQKYRCIFFRCLNFLYTPTKPARAKICSMVKKDTSVVHTQYVHVIRCEAKGDFLKQVSVGLKYGSGVITIFGSLHLTPYGLPTQPRGRKYASRPMGIIELWTSAKHDNTLIHLPNTFKDRALNLVGQVGQSFLQR